MGYVTQSCVKCHNFIANADVVLNVHVVTMDATCLC